MLGATREIKFSVQDFKWKKFQNHTYISEDSHQKTIFIIQLMILGVRNCCEDVHTSIKFTFTFSNSRVQRRTFKNVVYSWNSRSTKKFNICIILAKSWITKIFTLVITILSLALPVEKKLMLHFNEIFIY